MIGIIGKLVEIRRNNLSNRKPTIIDLHSERKILESRKGSRSSLSELDPKIFGSQREAKVRNNEVNRNRLMLVMLRNIK